MTQAAEGLIIREFEPADMAPVVDMLRALQIMEMPFNRHLKAPEEIGPWYVEVLLRKCRDSRGRIVIADMGGTAAGCAVFLARVKEGGEEEEREHSYALVSELVVAEGFRGRGIAGALLAECERIALSLGQDELRLAVYLWNEPALALYRRSGFETAKLRMAKRLT